MVKRLRPELELNAWVQYERWKAPIYKTGQQSDTTVSRSADLVSEAAYVAPSSIRSEDPAGWAGLRTRRQSALVYTQAAACDAGAEVFERALEAFAQRDLRAPSRAASRAG